MKILDLIFELVYQHVPMKQEDYARMRDEAEKDVRTWHTESDKPWKRLYAKYNNSWMFNLATAVAYIPLTRMIRDYMNGSSVNDSEE